MVTIPMIPRMARVVLVGSRVAVIRLLNSSKVVLAVSRVVDSNSILVVLEDEASKSGHLANSKSHVFTLCNAAHYVVYFRF
jgi:hypothetical protein